MSDNYSLCDSNLRTTSSYRSYIILHRGIRYFRITVPNHLRFFIGKREIRRSLDGLDSRAAHTMAARLSLVAHSFFAMVEDIQKGRIHFYPQDKSQSLEIIKEKIKKLDTVWFSLAQDQGFSPAALILHLPELLKSLDMEGEVLMGHDLQSCSSLPAKTATIMPTDISSVHIRRHGDDSSSKSPPKSSSASLPRLSEAAHAYIEAKKLTWSEGSIRTTPPIILQFAEIVKELEHGHDIRVDELSRNHVRNYYETLKYLPFRVNGRSKYQGKSWLKLAELGRSGKVERLLSLKTMEVRQTNIRSFINWAELEYKGVVQARYINSGFPNVMSNRDIRRKGTKRSSFTREELQELFGNRERYAKASERGEAKFWSPWIALYTGMRVEEICQLTLSDICSVDGIFCFSINENGGRQGNYKKHVKTVAGIRNVPIHLWLWNHGGFGQFVENKKTQVSRKLWSNTMLFSDMEIRAKEGNFQKEKFSAGITHWFTRYRRAVGVGGQEGETSSKTFHSFRHTVVEYLLKDARVPLNMVQTVVGHEITDMGVTEVYAGEWPMSVLLEEVIMKLRWHEWL